MKSLKLRITACCAPDFITFEKEVYFAFSHSEHSSIYKKSADDSEKMFVYTDEVEVEVSFQETGSFTNKFTNGDSTVKQEISIDQSDSEDETYQVRHSWNCEGKKDSTIETFENFDDAIEFVESNWEDWKSWESTDLLGYLEA